MMHHNSVGVETLHPVQNFSKYSSCKEIKIILLSELWKMFYGRERGKRVEVLQ